mmetsp:Transcript_24282/g.65827  ORF Transcript_24282/g.65827 Transcript_24282/m.65827 type:complete len:206 (+) Transcript_24282:1159-1776(+)
MQPSGSRPLRWCAGPWCWTCPSSSCARSSRPQRWTSTQRSTADMGTSPWDSNSRRQASSGASSGPSAWRRSPRPARDDQVRGEANPLRLPSPAPPTATAVAPQAPPTAWIARQSALPPIASLGIKCPPSTSPCRTWAWAKGRISISPTPARAQGIQNLRSRRHSALRLAACGPVRHRWRLRLRLSPSRALMALPRGLGSRQLAVR